MATRQKRVVISGVTREQADDALAQYAKADARISKINAEIDLQVAKVREKYQSELMQLSSQRQEAFDTLDSFAKENREDLFSKKKSLDMAHGTIGFRMGTPKLKTLKGHTWASALNAVKRFLPYYVRTKEELDKDKLLADRDGETVVCSGSEEKVTMRDAMKECGIEVTQEENFFVELKKEDTEKINN